MRPLTFILSHCGRGKKREFSPEGRGEKKILGEGKRFGKRKKRLY